MQNTMKLLFKIVPLLFGGLLMIGMQTSCNDEGLVNNGEPRVRYVRITDPASSDSLLMGAYQSNLIAIVGDNLQGAEQIWFNDLRASVNPNYISNTSILTTTPGDIPLVIDNKLKIVFSDGTSLTHDFKIEISEPQINSMSCEYVKDGEIATIRGAFFYEPLTVTFTGNLFGELVEVEDGVIQVKVPVGAQVGPIKVSTNFGETESDLWFRDNRNIFISSDPFTGWWNASYVVTSPGADDPIAINGNYIRVKKAVGAWAWTEVAGGPASAMGAISKNIPDDAIQNPEDYNFKFEVNTVKPYNSNMIKFNFGIAGENNNEFRWAPPYDTKGKWQTVVIPLEEIAAKQPLATSPIADGYWTRILMHGPGALDADISFDNFRIVPKVLKD
jgi:hypothetical protein